MILVGQRRVTADTTSTVKFESCINTRIPIWQQFPPCISFIPKDLSSSSYFSSPPPQILFDLSHNLHHAEPTAVDTYYSQQTSNAGVCGGPPGTLRPRHRTPQESRTVCRSATGFSARGGVFRVSFFDHHGSHIGSSRLCAPVDPMPLFCTLTCSTLTAGDTINSNAYRC